MPHPPAPDPLDRLLRQTLADARPEAPHVDAERLAAWAAKLVPAEEAAGIEQHLSQCDRCQAMLAVFSRIDTAPAPAPSMWERWRLAWVIPATAAAAATLAWVAWPGRVPVTPPPTAVVAQAEPQNRVVVAPEPEIGLRGAAPAPRDAAQVAQQGQQGQQQVQQGQQQGQQGAQTMADARQERRADPATPLPSRSQGFGAAAPPPAQATMPPPPPPATPPPPPMPKPAAAPVVTTATPPMAMTESVATTVIYTFSSADVAAKDTQPTGAVGGVAGGGGGGAGRGGRGGGGAVTAPSFRQANVLAPVRWRILSSGVVERSLDNGTTWTVIELKLDPPARVTTGAAPSPAVCWLAGRGGLVLLSTDGVRFDRLKFPETMDLSSIRATDARQASVTTADGRVFVTTDGGATWRREQPGSSPQAKTRR